MRFLVAASMELCHSISIFFSNRSQTIESLMKYMGDAVL